MNPKQQEDMAKRLVDILIATGIFNQTYGRRSIRGVNTDAHHWIRMNDIREKEELIQAIKEAIGIYEGECLTKAWAKHKKDSGT